MELPCGVPSPGPADPRPGGQGQRRSKRAPSPARNLPEIQEYVKAHRADKYPRIVVFRDELPKPSAVRYSGTSCKKDRKTEGLSQNAWGADKPFRCGRPRYKAAGSPRPYLFGLPGFIPGVERFGYKFFTAATSSGSGLT